MPLGFNGNKPETSKSMGSIVKSGDRLPSGFERSGEILFRKHFSNVVQVA
jgi:hypothetical protein